jgi:hypothetical protein
MKAVIDTAADLGVKNIVIGMPHRGRLNVLGNVVRKPLRQIFTEFSGGPAGLGMLCVLCVPRVPMCWAACRVMGVAALGGLLGAACRAFSSAPVCVLGVRALGWALSLCARLLPAVWAAPAAAAASCAAHRPGPSPPPSQERAPATRARASTRGPAT